MPVIPVNYANVVVTIDIPGPGGPAQLTWGANPTSGLPSAESTAINTADTLNNLPGLASVLDSNAVIREVTVYFNGGGTDLEVATASVNQAGQVSGVAAPPQVALLVQKRSGLAGRRNTGRLYIPAISSTIIGEDGIVSGANYTAFQTAMTALHTDLLANEVAMRILHDDPAFAPTDVTSLFVVPLVATQRRRLR